MVGNTDMDSVRGLIDSVEAQRRSTAPAPVLPYIRRLPAGLSLIRESVMNPDSVNCACCAVWQFPAEDKHRVQLFAHCIKNHVFHELRTVRQMGYVVWSFFSSIEGNCAYVVILQSNSVGPVSCTDA